MEWKHFILILNENQNGLKHSIITIITDNETS